MFRLASQTHSRFAIDLVDECLQAAARLSASDVHFNPSHDQWQIWFRIDGVLVPHREVQRCNQTDPVSRLMALTGLPTYRGGSPQEALLRWTPENESSGGQPERGEADVVACEMRLAVFPTVHGPRAVVRRMSEAGNRGLGELGFAPEIVEQLRKWCRRVDGLVLMVGPAGSGKTTALYGCLKEIAASNEETPQRRSVLTIEDPVESTLAGVNQSQIDSNSMSLAVALRAAVRQDADVLLVSEIRDSATASAVIDASMLGHLAFSSMHAGGIGVALCRLRQMDLPTHAIQSGLAGICNLRLLRQKCHCDARDNCELCHGTGYFGRLPIASVLSMDSEAGSAAMSKLGGGGSAAEVERAAAGAGMAGLLDEARRMVADRRTDATEVQRVLGDVAVSTNSISGANE